MEPIVQYFSIEICQSYHSICLRKKYFLSPLFLSHSPTVATLVLIYNYHWYFKNHLCSFQFEVKRSWLPLRPTEPSPRSTTASTRSALGSRRTARRSFILFPTTHLAPKTLFTREIRRVQICALERVGEFSLSCSCRREAAFDECTNFPKHS